MQCEVRSVVVDGLTRHQLTDDVQRLVHPAAPCCRIDTTDLDLVGILATDADAEQEPARRQGGEVGELPGDGDRVAQREQVHGGVRRHSLGHRKDSRSAEQSIESGADDEADVVAHPEMIKATLLGELDQGTTSRRLEQADAREDAPNADGAHGPQVVICTSGRAGISRQRAPRARCSR